MVTLKGFASLPADTFADGPSSGTDNGRIDAVNRIQPISANGRSGPFDGQPVQGFSGVQFAPNTDDQTFWFLSDNGFGGESNSTDYLLRIYQAKPSFNGQGGDGSVDIQGFVQLSDPNGLIPFDIQNGDSDERLLAGSDFDIESFVIDNNGDIWVGEEFGPYILHFNSEGELLEAPIPTPNPVDLNTLNGQAPLVIGHRGASGDFPEHTLEAYRAAIAAGADFIEPDVVITSDGVLIARHEPMLDDTTNVAEVFGPERMSTKMLDGAEVTAYFAEDFTWEEIQQLRAVQSRDFRDPAFDGLFKIPSLEQVIELVQEVEAQTGVQVGIYPETKHPTFFDNQGLSLEEALVKTLGDTGFTDPDRIFIQSFEVSNLIDLSGQLAEAGLGDIPLVQLFGDTEGSFINEGGGGFSVPYDFVVNAASAFDVPEIVEVEGNDTLETAQEIPLTSFANNLDTGIQDVTGVNISASTFHASITATGDETLDYYSFEAVAGDTLHLDIDDSTFDTELFLFSADGTLLANNDDEAEPGNTGVGNASFVTFTVEESGTYVVGVAEFSSSGEDGGIITGDLPPVDGVYELTISRSTDPANVPEFVGGEFNEDLLRPIYGDALVDALDFSAAPNYSDLANQDLIDVISEYASGLGPWKNNILLRESLDTPVDGDGDGVAEITSQLTGEVFPLIDFAHNSGLQIHPYTLRDEERFLTLNEDGTPQTPEEEFQQLVELGVDGFFTDFPRTGDPVVDKLTSDEVRSPNNPDFDFNTLNGQTPLVIGHRGASGDFPEHTLEAYRLAIYQGADFVEPDLVITSDGVLIARHEPMLDDTTNVAEVFGPERMSTKMLDGAEVTAYFAEDFTLAEIKQLRAVQSRDFRSDEFDGQFEIPTFEEVIQLVEEVSGLVGREIGIYPETKHPTFFDEQGLSLEEPLVQTLVDTGFTDRDRIFIQSFEISNLLDLRNNILPAAGLDNLQLVQLFGDTEGSFINDGGGGFSVPYDLVVNADLSDAEKEAIYGDLLPFLDFENPGYDSLANGEAITEISSYADGLGPWKNNILLRESFATSEDRDGNGTNETILQRITFDTTEGVFGGLVAYNSELFTGEGTEIVDPANSLELDIDFFGTTLTEEDDSLFDFFPQLTLEDGVPVNLEYQILTDDLSFSITGVTGDLEVEFEQGPVTAPTLAGEGIVEIPVGITSQLTGEVVPLVDFAHDAGLQIHPYTLRDEPRFLTLNPDGTIQTAGEEFEQLIELGVDGFFTDFPETGRIIVEQFETAEEFANLRGSRGYEGMAFSPDRLTLYPMLEGSVFGDPAGSLRIYEFDVASSAFEGILGLYQLEETNHAIGDFTPINDDEFLVIERDGGQAAGAEFKKIFKVDLSNIDADGFVEKTEVADLLNIADPDDLNGDGETTFTFPFVTIEDVLVLDETTILVANDNNYPFSIGRDFTGTEIDNNEVIVLELDNPLNLDSRLGAAAIPDADPIVGDDGDNEVIGTVSNDTIAGGLGADIIAGGSGDDVLRGDLDSRNPQGNAGGDDLIFGGAGNDRIGGKGGNDELFGDAGDDLIWGDDGDDIIRGDLGNDTLTGDNFSGGSGSDTFILASGEGTDTIVDFEVGIDFIGLADGLTFDQLSLGQSGDTAVISFGDEDLALLNGVAVSALTETAFTVV